MNIILGNLNDSDGLDRYLSLENRHSHNLIMLQCAEDFTN